MTRLYDPRPILVIGRTGALGQEMRLQLEAAGLPHVSLGRGDLDTGADVAALLQTVEKIEPRAIVNCIAMTGLDKCFREPPQAFECNGVFPTKLAALCKALDVPVLQFSTENVFSCNISGLAYRETDETRPTTVYGLSKLMGEARDLRDNAPFHVVRLPLMFGPTNRRQIVHRLVKELLRGNEVGASTDVYSTPVYTPDVAAFAVAWLRGAAPLAKITHLTAGHMTSLHELIRIIADNIKAKGKLQAMLSSRFPSLEMKPLHGGLASDVTPPLSWDSAIERYVNWIKANETVFASDP